MDHRLKALLEVILVFIVVMIVFMALYPLIVLNRITLLGNNTFTIVCYLLWAAIILGLLFATKRDLSGYGIAIRNMHSELETVVVCLLPMSVIVFLNYWPIPFPNLIEFTLGMAAVYLSLLFVTAILLNRISYKNKKIAFGALTLIAIGALGVIPIMTSAQMSGIMAILPLSVYNFIVLFAIVGPVEELVFRGYIQSRLNEAFDRPYKLFGTSWGAGLIITSLLFGVMHLMNVKFNLLIDSYELNWYWGVGTFFVALIFGLVRENTGNIAAPSFLHGFNDFFSFIFRSV